MAPWAAASTGFRRAHAAAAAGDLLAGRAGIGVIEDGGGGSDETAEARAGASEVQRARRAVVSAVSEGGPQARPTSGLVTAALAGEGGGTAGAVDMAVALSATPAPAPAPGDVSGKSMEADAA